jgi:hypothetical protein
MNLYTRVSLPKIFFVAVFLLNSLSNLNAQVGIGASTVTPDPSSMLDIQSTTKGLLIPRMTSAQRSAITSPADGLIVYQTDVTKGYYYYNSTSSLWVMLGAQLTFSTGLTNTNGTVTVNATQNIANLSNLNSAGVVTTSGTSGALTVTSVLPIANGGTNSSAALNNDRIMVSSGGKIVESAALTNGQLLVGSTGAAPVVTNLTAGSGIDITNGAGSITISSSSTSINMVSASSDFALTTSWQTITGLSYSVSANTTYRFKAIILYRSTTAASGANFSFLGPGTAGVANGNDVFAYSGLNYRNGTTDAARFTGNSYNLTQGVAESFVGANMCVIEGIIKVGSSSGTFSVRGIAEANSQLTVLSGSTLQIW